MKYQIKTFYQVCRPLEVEADSLKEAVVKANNTPPESSELLHNEKGELEITKNYPQMIAGVYKNGSLCFEGHGHINWWDFVI